MGRRHALATFAALNSKHCALVGRSGNAQNKKATNPEGLVAGRPDKFRSLEHKPHTELNLALRTERVNARAVAHTERLVVRMGRSIDGTRTRSIQDAVHRVRRQVEVAEVEIRYRSQRWVRA
jgi:hypothetical protein